MMGQFQQKKAWKTHQTHFWLGKIGWKMTNCPLKISKFYTQISRLRGWDPDRCKCSCTCEAARLRDAWDTTPQVSSNVVYHGKLLIFINIPSTINHQTSSSTINQHQTVGGYSKSQNWDQLGVPAAGRCSTPDSSRWQWQVPLRCMACKRHGDLGKTWENVGKCWDLTGENAEQPMFSIIFSHLEHQKKPSQRASLGCRQLTLHLACLSSHDTSNIAGSFGDHHPNLCLGKWTNHTKEPLDFGYTTIHQHIPISWWLDRHSRWQSRHLKSQHGSLKVMSKTWNYYMIWPAVGVHLKRLLCLGLYLHYTPLYPITFPWNILEYTIEIQYQHHLITAGLDIPVYPLSHCTMRRSSLYQMILPETSNDRIGTKFLMKFQWFS